MGTVVGFMAIGFFVVLSWFFVFLYVPETKNLRITDVLDIIIPERSKP